MAIATDTPRRTPRQQRATSRSSRNGGSGPEQLATRDVAAPDVDVLVPRFLNILIPAVTQFVAPHLSSLGGALGGAIGGKGGSQIGSQVGGLLGGILGARGEIGDADVEIARALEQAQLTQVVTQLAQECTPRLIEAMQQEVQSRASRGEPAEVDDEALERGWGFLASLITDVVVTHGPDVIKAATKLFGRGGSRDVDESTPLMVDTEMTQRFIGPAISALLTGVQASLPQLFTLLTANREIPRDMGISWADLSATKRLWDNDNITVLSQTPIDNPNEIELVLELAPHKTWWKGIQVQDDNGSFVAEIGVQDRTKVASVRVPAQQLLSPGGYLVFMKAKFMGIHTGMYRLATGGLDQLAGQRTHFFWYAD